MLVCVARQVEATGSENVANEAINYVRRGGTLMVYGVYDNAARVHWSPAKIFLDEIKVCRGLLSPHSHMRLKIRALGSL